MHMCKQEKLNIVNKISHSANFVILVWINMDDLFPILIIGRKIENNNNNK